MRLRPARTRQPDGPLQPSRHQLRAVLGYLAIVGVYIGIGLYTVDFLLSFWVALAYFLLAAWLLPAGLRLLRSRLGAGS